MVIFLNLSEFMLYYFHSEGEVLVTYALFHSQFYLEEAKGRVDYQGYIFPRRRGETVSDFSFILFNLNATKIDENK